MANCQKIEKSIADILLTIYPYCCTTNTNDKEEKEYDYNGSDTSYQGFVFRQGKNLAETVTILGVDWRTVRKYVDKEDFNEPIPVAQGNKPKV